MATPVADVAAALVHAAQSINDAETLEGTLDAIAHAARDTVPGIDHAGISLSHRNGTIETMAGTDPLVWRLDSIQYDLGEGPCVESVHSRPVVVVEHARHDQRWPNYMPRAVQEGLQAQLALRLYTKDETLGGLNLYSTRSETIDPDALQIAELFASHAAIALRQAGHRHQLNEAISTRKVIGQAIGIVMERYKLSEDRAFRFLVRASSTSNIKLRLIAEELVAAANRDHERTGRELR